jgi:hypothetical protein
VKGGRTVAGELAAGVIGGVVGGALGVLGTGISAYYGPRKLEEWRDARRDEPRKRLLRVMLEDTKRFRDGRYLTTLCRCTGTSPEECRRLLIDIDARGVRLSEGEGWALIKNKPLHENPDLETP